jgi:hypothetical protein
MNLLVAGFIVFGGCNGVGTSPDPPTPAPTLPRGLKMTLKGPPAVDLEEHEFLTYEAYVENDGPKPIAIAVHPIWLRLEILTMDGERVKLLNYGDVDWVPTSGRDLVIIKPGERRLFEVVAPGGPEPGTYTLRAVIKPMPTDVPAGFIREMRDEDAAFLRSDCRSPTVTVKVL